MELTSSAALRQRLREMGEPGYAASTSKLIPGLRRKIYGVRIPALRALAKELAGGDTRAALQHTLSGTSLEEVTLCGLVTGYAPAEWAEWTERVAAFVPLIDNWQTCDTACPALSLIRQHRRAGRDFLAPYLHSGEEFAQRFGLVMLLEHYLTDEWHGTTLEETASLRPAGYYAAMAGGWLLQAAFVKWPHDVFRLLQGEAADHEVRRLARKKLLESLRTPAEWRGRIMDLKI